MKTRKTLLSYLLLCGMTISFLLSGVSAYSESTPASKFNVAYLDFTAFGSCGTIPSNAFGVLDVVVLAFADVTTSTFNTAYIPNIQAASKGATKANAKLFFSIGGANATPTTICTATEATVVSNVIAQISQINAAISGVKITGIDLDLENGIDAQTTKDLATMFQSQGYLVSVAPQIYATTPNGSIDSASPTNMVLTSAGIVDTYSAALSSKAVSYIFAQGYNTSGFTIDSYSESDPNFSAHAIKAVQNYVSSYTAPNSQPIMCCIGQVVNQMAGYQGGNIFNPNNSPLPTSYNQTSILNSFNTALAGAEASGSWGVMCWSLNNDYNPSGYSDTYAVPGNFFNIIFGAPAVPTGPYFILQLSNTNTNSSATTPCMSITIVVNGGYYPFGSISGGPLAPNAYQMWGTVASAANTPGVVDSWNLDTMFSGGVSSVQASQVLINTFTSTSATTPSKQINAGPYTFVTGKAYNVMANPVTGVSQITGN